ncbi:MAG: PadR family transcriptional regulator [Wenzhouxiangellaceae bacterium]|nr:PadR family transcriptional regulator [Wenzhouxiangellaceae bacterium]
MSLPHILLGMLDKPASGYDLKHRFEQQLSHYWSADLAQIYPTLKRMRDRGLLTARREPSTKGPPKNVYARTEAGQRELEAWLTQGPDVHADRLGWLAQVGFLDTLEAPERRAFLERLRDEFIRHREELVGIEAHWRDEDPRFPDALPERELFAHMTLRLGLEKYAAIIAWCEECLERLERRRKVAADPPASKAAER